MAFLWTVLGAATALFLVLLGVLFLDPGAESDHVLRIIQATGSLFVPLSAAVAYRVYRSTVDRHRADESRKASEGYLTESRQLLDKALETFISRGANPPKSDRLLWLSTARMILRFQRMRDNISTNDHLAIIDGAEEFSRLRFYAILDENKALLTKSYFMPSGVPGDGTNIARVSIAAIFAFSRWKKDAPDPLQNVDDKRLFADGVVPLGQFGVREFLQAHPAYWADIQLLRQIGGSSGSDD